MTLSGLSLSPWSSPVNCPLHLNLTLLHKDYRTPSSPPTPSWWESLCPYSGYHFHWSWNTSGLSVGVKCLVLTNGFDILLLCTMCLQNSGLFFFQGYKLDSPHIISQHIWYNVPLSVFWYVLLWVDWPLSQCVCQVWKTQECCKFNFSVTPVTHVLSTWSHLVPSGLIFYFGIFLFLGSSVVYIVVVMKAGDHESD